MNEKLLDFVKSVGVPAAIALALMYVLSQEQRRAAEERAQHTVILIDQLTALRKACICAVADVIPEGDPEVEVRAAKAKAAARNVTAPAVISQ